MCLQSTQLTITETQTWIYLYGEFKACALSALWSCTAPSPTLLLLHDHKSILHVCVSFLSSNRLISTGFLDSIHNIHIFLTHCLILLFFQKFLFLELKETVPLLYNAVLVSAVHTQVHITRPLFVGFPPLLVTSERWVESPVLCSVPLKCLACGTVFTLGAVPFRVLLSHDSGLWARVAGKASVWMKALAFPEEPGGSPGLTLAGCGWPLLWGVRRSDMAKHRVAKGPGEYPAG